MKNKNIALFFAISMFLCQMIAVALNDMFSIIVSSIFFFIDFIAYIKLS